MAKIAYILLCHKDPAAIVRQAQQLVVAGDYVAIHFDASAPRAEFAEIRAALADVANVCLVERRVRCGWGEWSLVEATIATARAALRSFPDATHLYMLSGDCMAIKTAEYVHDFLDADDADFIESVDFFASDWIRTGWREERLIYRHVFNERAQKRLFYASFEVQKRLGLRRRIPEDLQMMIGSQWWCLRRATVEAVLAFAARRRDVVRFFRTTWIPDETFFQTLVRHLVPAEQIRARTLTFLMFTDYGMPVTFCNDHYDLLLSQDFLFARKISPEAQVLKRRLGLLYAATGIRFKISNEGQSLFRFLTGRGRVGQRYAPRFWEKDTDIGRTRELMIVVCKKWHVAKRLVHRIRQTTNLPVIEYLFDEDGCALPDLGGIEKTVWKRSRHRRATVRMLFDFYETDRLIICVDPRNFDLLTDFSADRAETRILEILCNFSEDDLVGHAIRVGLAGEQTSEETWSQLLPTIRADIHEQSDRIADAGFDRHYRLRQDDAPEENIDALAAFLSAEAGAVAPIVDRNRLFAD